MSLNQPFEVVTSDRCREIFSTAMFTVAELPRPGKRRRYCHAPTIAAGGVSSAAFRHPSAAPNGRG
jgi:hypothetical protein